MESATGSFKWPRVLFPAARRSEDRAVAWPCSFDTLLEAFTGRPRCPVWRPVWLASMFLLIAFHFSICPWSLRAQSFKWPCLHLSVSDGDTSRRPERQRHRGKASRSRYRKHVENAGADWLCSKRIGNRRREREKERERSGDTVARAAVQTVSLLAVFTKPRRAAARHFGPFHANLCLRQLELRICLSVETPCRRLLATTLISAHSLLTCDARSLPLRWPIYKRPATRPNDAFPSAVITTECRSAAVDALATQRDSIVFNRLVPGNPNSTSISAINGL